MASRIGFVSRRGLRAVQSADAGQSLRGQTMWIAGTVAFAAAAFGAFAASDPRLALILLAAAALVPAVLFPIAGLAMLVSITALVPFDIQNRFGIASGADDPGLLVVDVLLIIGLAHAGWLWLRRGWDTPMVLGTLVLVLAVAQFFHGLAGDWPANDAGTETRRFVLGVGGFLLALHVFEREGLRQRAVGGLLVLGLAVGVWGLAQWYLGISFTQDGELGVRDAVPFTTSGRGQLQGGLFVYPIVVILTFAALVSGALSGRWRIAVALVLALNALALLFTYERTFWAAAVLGCAFVLVRESPAGRRRAFVTTPLVAGALVLLLAVTAPGDLVAAGERLVSVSKFQTDESVRYRQIESAAVADAIRERPLIGHGFGAGVTWDFVSSGVGETTTFAHNGYLWLAWKLGTIVAGLVILGIAASIARRAGTRGPSLHAVLRRGAQGALVALLVINITFPSFNNLAAGVTTGIVLALCWRPVARL